MDLSQFNQLGRELTPYGTFRDKVESDPELIGYDRYSYGTSQDKARSEADSGRFLHGGGGNETLRDYGLAYEAASKRGQYQRDDSWVLSLIPEIRGRSNIIPQVKSARRSIEEKIGQRQREITDTEDVARYKQLRKDYETAERIRKENSKREAVKELDYRYVRQTKPEDDQKVFMIKDQLAELEPKIKSTLSGQSAIAEKEIFEARNEETVEYMPTIGNRGRIGNFGRFNEMNYDRLQKAIKVKNEEADLQELQNLNKNYEEDIKQAQNLNKLLKEYEKEKKFEFLNEYESRSGGVFSMGGPDAPALTPTGSMRYRSRSENSGFKAVSFDVPQKPFEAKPILSSRQERRYEDNIMKQMRKQEIPFKNDFGLATRKEKRFNAKRFFG